MKRSLSLITLSLIVLISCYAQGEDEESKNSGEHQNDQNEAWVLQEYPSVKEFRYDTEIYFANKGIIHNVSFSKREYEFIGTKIRCNLTLYNDTQESKSVNVTAEIYNEDGVTLWEGTEDWWSNLEAGEKHTISWEVEISMPDALDRSRFSEDFDDTPVAVDCIRND